MTIFCRYKLSSTLQATAEQQEDDRMTYANLTLYFHDQLEYIVFRIVC